MVGYFSTVGIIKCVAKPTVTLKDYRTDNINMFDNTFLGEYIQDTSFGDSTEKVYSYNFCIYNESNELLATSGELVHDATQDTSSDSSEDTWKIYTEFNQGEVYYLQYTVTTLNGLVVASAKYKIMKVISVPVEYNIQLHADVNYDNGYIDVTLEGKQDETPIIHYDLVTSDLRYNSNENYYIKNQFSDNDYSLITDFSETSWEQLKNENKLYIKVTSYYLLEEAYSGLFIITRSSAESNFKEWIEVTRFTLQSSKPSTIHFKDKTVEQGIEYKYALQQYNTYGVYSAKTYQTDHHGNLNTTIADFEDMFLSDGLRQLRIRFDPKVAKFAETIPEKKVETIGSKYPFIFRNGAVNYKEFSVAGLISYQMDDAKLFLTNSELLEAGILEYDYARGNTKIDSLYQKSGHEANLHYETERKTFYDQITGKTYTKNITKEVYEPNIVYNEDKQSYYHSSIDYPLSDEPSIVRTNKDLTSDNIKGERYFKLKVLDWLNDGKVKLFRSATEGNYLVRLLKVSLKPQDKLGRMLHSFTCTAYEIDELSYTNLVKYGIVTPREAYNFEEQWGNVNIKEVIKKNKPDKDGFILISPEGIGMNTIAISNFAPGDQIKVVYDQDNENIFTIGVTGNLSLDKDDRTIVKVYIKLNDQITTYNDFERELIYSYSASTKTRFDSIAEVKIQTRTAEQFVGPKENLLEPFDLRRAIMKNPDNEGISSEYLPDATGKNNILVDIQEHNRFNYNIETLDQTTVEKFTVKNVDILHVWKRKLIPIFAYDTTITNNTQFGITPFEKGFVNNQSIINFYDTDLNHIDYKDDAEDIYYNDGIQKTVNINDIYTLLYDTTDNSIYPNDASTIFQAYIWDDSINNWIPSNVEGKKYFDNFTQSWWDDNITYDPSFSINNKLELSENEQNNSSFGPGNNLVADNNISLNEVNEITLYNLGQLSKITLGSGVIAEVSVEMTVVDYGIEISNIDVAKAKQNYIDAKTNYKNKIESILVNVSSTVDPISKKEELENKLELLNDSIENGSSISTYQNVQQAVKEKIINLKKKLWFERQDKILEMINYLKNNKLYYSLSNLQEIKLTENYSLNNNKTASNYNKALTAKINNITQPENQFSDTAIERDNIKLQEYAAETTTINNVTYNYINNQNFIDVDFYESEKERKENLLAEYQLQKEALEIEQGKLEGGDISEYDETNLPPENTIVYYEYQKNEILKKQEKEFEKINDKKLALVGRLLQEELKNPEKNSVFIDPTTGKTALDFTNQYIKDNASQLLELLQKYKIDQQNKLEELETDCVDGLCEIFSDIITDENIEIYKADLFKILQNKLPPIKKETLKDFSTSIKFDGNETIKNPQEIQETLTSLQNWLTEIKNQYSETGAIAPNWIDEYQSKIQDFIEVETQYNNIFSELQEKQNLLESFLNLFRIPYAFSSTPEFTIKDSKYSVTIKGLNDKNSSGINAYEILDEKTQQLNTLSFKKAIDNSKYSSYYKALSNLKSDITKYENGLITLYKEIDNYNKKKKENNENNEQIALSGENIVIRTDSQTGGLSETWYKTIQNQLLSDINSSDYRTLVQAITKAIDSLADISNNLHDDFAVFPINLTFTDAGVIKQDISKESLENIFIDQLKYLDSIDVDSNDIWKKNRAQVQSPISSISEYFTVLSNAQNYKKELLAIQTDINNFIKDYSIYSDPTDSLIYTQIINKENISFEDLYKILQTQTLKEYLSNKNSKTIYTLQNYTLYNPILNNNISTLNTQINMLESIQNFNFDTNTKFYSTAYDSIPLSILSNFNQQIETIRDDYISKTQEIIDNWLADKPYGLENLVFDPTIDDLNAEAFKILKLFTNTSNSKQSNIIQQYLKQYYPAEVDTNTSIDKVISEIQRLDSILKARADVYNGMIAQYQAEEDNIQAEINKIKDIIGQSGTLVSTINSLQRDINIDTAELSKAKNLSGILDSSNLIKKIINNTAIISNLKILSNYLNWIKASQKQLLLQIGQITSQASTGKEYTELIKNQINLYENEAFEFLHKYDSIINDLAYGIDATASSTSPGTDKYFFLTNQYFLPVYNDSLFISNDDIILENLRNEDLSIRIDTYRLLKDYLEKLFTKGSSYDEQTSLSTLPVGILYNPNTGIFELVKIDSSGNEITQRYPIITTFSKNNSIGKQITDDLGKIIDNSYINSQLIFDQSSSSILLETNNFVPQNTSGIYYQENSTLSNLVVAFDNTFSEETFNNNYQRENFQKVLWLAQPRPFVIILTLPSYLFDTNIENLSIIKNNSNSLLPEDITYTLLSPITSEQMFNNYLGKIVHDKASKEWNISGTNFTTDEIGSFWRLSTEYSYYLTIVSNYCNAYICLHNIPSNNPNLINYFQNQQEINANEQERANWQRIKNNCEIVLEEYSADDQDKDLTQLNALIETAKEKIDYYNKIIAVLLEQSSEIQSNEIIQNYLAISTIIEENQNIMNIISNDFTQQEQLYFNKINHYINLLLNEVPQTTQINSGILVNKELLNINNIPTSTYDFGIAWALEHYKQYSSSEYYNAELSFNNIVEAANNFYELMFLDFPILEKNPTTDVSYNSEHIYYYKNSENGNNKYIEYQYVDENTWQQDKQYLFICLYPVFSDFINYNRYIQLKQSDWNISYNENMNYYSKHSKTYSLLSKDSFKGALDSNNLYIYGNGGFYSFINYLSNTKNYTIYIKNISDEYLQSIELYKNLVQSIRDNEINLKNLKDLREKYMQELSDIENIIDKMTTGYQENQEYVNIVQAYLAEYLRILTKTYIEEIERFYGVV